jgi:lipopolysaccharide/colanic/teichoic acid biosynthesis glycosyltransferase
MKTQSKAFFERLRGWTNSRECPSVASSGHICTETEFTNLIRLERRRAERSQKPFLLMLLAQQALDERNGSKCYIEQVASVVSSSIRETDVIGWYQSGTIIGVIFTDLANASQNVISTILQRVDASVQCVTVPDERAKLAISWYVFPDSAGDSYPRQPALALYPDLKYRDTVQQPFREIKRIVDIVGSLLTLILLSPVFAAVSIAIKLSSEGPILFRQERLGHNNTPFIFLKFRSMRSDSQPDSHRQYITSFIAGEAKGHSASKDGSLVYKLVGDPRVTALGRVLRRTSLDELPQLINVLKGDMSLVGPRPPLPYELQVYDIWHRRRLMESRPGITGLWQISGRSRVKFDDMVRLDLRYAQKWSLWMDVKILLQTPRAILSGEGAY